MSRVPRFLLAIYLIEAAILAIDPVDRTVWLAENLTAVLPVAGLVVLYFRKIRFSNTAYAVMTLFFLLHTVGGHYTFELVPLDDLFRALGAQRNHYDRICHFMVGGFAFGLCEFLETRGIVRGRPWVIVLAVMSIFGFAAIFELIEWIYAVLADPAAGNAFLGSQGDIWDAQKDMLCDGLGAIVFSALYCLIRPAKNADGNAAAR